MADGRFDDQFPVDVFQTGSGTSTNMNVNEVIANRAIELSGGDRFAPEKPIHPNDHVNMGQSTNDVFPTAIHVAVALGIREQLLPALQECGRVLAEKAAAWKDILKIGRTHLVDATPLALGQEFGGLARQLDRSAAGPGWRWRRCWNCPSAARRWAAASTPIRSSPAASASARPRRRASPFVEAADHFEANAQRDGLVECHGQLRTVAATLFNVANNIRWLSSGPQCGIHEIRLPDLQPGSSIMPGKVNPVMCESLMQAAARVLGNDQTDRLLRGGRRPVPVERHDAGHGRRGPGERPAAGPGDRRLHHRCLAGMEANAERLPGGGRAEPRHGHRLEPVHRLRAGGRLGQGGPGPGQDDPPTCPREEAPARRATRRRRWIPGG